MCRPLPSQLDGHLALKMNAGHFSYGTAGIYLGGSEAVTCVCYIHRPIDGISSCCRGSSWAWGPCEASRGGFLDTGRFTGVLG